MKLQCSCGAKYAFDITPEMVQNPVRFVCPQCGQDSSDFVNGLVRQEFGQAAAAPAAHQPPPAPEVPAAPRLRISHTEPPAAPVEAAPVAAVTCAQHRGVRATDRCVMCQKPICPQCLERFGHFCSSLCKNSAARAQSGKKFADEEQFWRKTCLLYTSPSPRD